MSIYPPTELVLSALRLELQSLPPLSIGVEIGAHEGATTAIMADAIIPKGGTLFCVDSYRSGYPEYKDDRDTNRLMNWLKNVDKRNVALVVAHSSVAARAFGDGSVDVVFIDGDHRYSRIIQDIILWWPKLKPKGIMCGDDYEGPEFQEDHADKDYMGGKHHGVIKAVTEQFGSAVVVENNFWRVTKRN